ncbi:hypothetical protein BDW02DRAFT_582358 [Decorospora gaudefroyi]|uniref:Uncharacterized protein n=1 Tax=Decorospora gaudefroyi TaxID=184978 RepID=A0A6A5K9G6_9PLEO|nr:hypothetical protein BDW02DRAFT_582358 [Decorospora gaudefroyi]
MPGRHLSEREDSTCRFLISAPPPSTSSREAATGLIHAPRPSRVSGWATQTGLLLLLCPSALVTPRDEPAPCSHCRDGSPLRSGPEVGARRPTQTVEEGGWELSTPPLLVVSKRNQLGITDDCPVCNGNADARGRLQPQGWTNHLSRMGKRHSHTRQAHQGRALYEPREWRFARCLACCVGASALITVSHMPLRSYPNGCLAVETTITVPRRQFAGARDGTAMHVVRREKMRLLFFSMHADPEYLSLRPELLDVVSLRLSRCYSAQPQTRISDRLATIVSEGKSQAVRLRPLASAGWYKWTDEVKPSLVSASQGYTGPLKTLESKGR